eukprot:1320990-Pleurochrysis_carterae.AAC.1
MVILIFFGKKLLPIRQKRILPSEPRPQNGTDRILSGRQHCIAGYREASRFLADEARRRETANDTAARIVLHAHNYAQHIDSDTTAAPLS